MIFSLFTSQEIIECYIDVKCILIIYITFIWFIDNEKVNYNIYFLKNTNKLKAITNILFSENHWTIFWEIVIDKISISSLQHDHISIHKYGIKMLMDILKFNELILSLPPQLWILVPSLRTINTWLWVFFSSLDLIQINGPKNV